MSGEDLRAAMRRHPAGVVVVTVDADGQRVGLTVATLVGLSLEPPLVGIAVSRQAALHELLREAGGFAVSILAAGQEAVAAHFARGVPPIGMWHRVAVEPGERGPLLAGAAAWLECGLAGEQPAGTHTFFTGAVESARLGPGEPPLLRLGGEYRAA